MDRRLIRDFISATLQEKKMREVDVSDGSRVPHGSSKHIKDLQARITGLEMWRNKQKRGTEARANYSRLISRLKSELASAKRQAMKESLVKEAYNPYKRAEEAIKRLQPHLKLTTKYKNGLLIVPKGFEDLRSVVGLRVSTWTLEQGDAGPPHLEIESPGGGINKHFDTPGAESYRAAWSKLWKLIYSKENPDKPFTIDEAIKVWPELEAQLVDINQKLSDLQNVKVLPKESPRTKKLMDQVFKDDDSFMRAVAEYEFFKNMGQEPGMVDRDMYISEYGEDDYWKDLKAMGDEIAPTVTAFVDSGAPLTIRGYEQFKAGPKPAKKPVKGRARRPNPAGLRRIK